jgi:hypothetical protein
VRWGDWARCRLWGQQRTRLPRRSFGHILGRRVRQQLPDGHLQPDTVERTPRFWVLLGTMGKRCRIHGCCYRRPGSVHPGANLQWSGKP